ncbi:DDE-type integrase/transposase/recombinase [Muricoccus pecuniae]|uniref:Putative transposase n=1 Tax=Muricoccus pecuniae TaxID=693023 RepID=A0A840XYL7_9PROT|nr:DDE-type integrase/transposase/recombinase [Roseomonas pecuniae]MBB5693575.1 putative transposase [Roseomonas pecuniae]
MTGFRLSFGDRVQIGADCYEFVRREPGRKKFTRKSDGAEVWYEDRDLTLKLTSGELSFPPHSAIPVSRHHLLRMEFSSMPEQIKQQAWMRRDYAAALQENTRLGCPHKARDVIKAVHLRRRAEAQEKGEGFREPVPGQSTAYYWKLIWTLTGGKDIRYLVFAEHNRGNKKARLEAVVADIVRDKILFCYLTPQRHFVATVHDAVVGECRRRGIPDNQAPCQETVRRWVRKLSPYAVLKARHGKRAADLAFGASGVAPVPARPGEVYEVDAHRIDLIIIDGRTGAPLGRPWITVAVDRCTRCIVGFHVHLEPPSSLTIAGCLRNAIAPKLYVSSKWPQLGADWPCWGVPVMVVLDNAFENKADFLKEAAAELGFTLFWTKPDTPEWKAVIERWFGTLETGFIRRIPGATGNSPDDRGDYAAERMACATLEDVDELAHRYVVTVYNRSHHRGINDVPDRLWREHTAEWEVRAPLDIASLDALLAYVFWRVPSNKGIELLGLHYNDRHDHRILELIRTRPGSPRKMTLKIRMDPTDLEFIWVLDPATGRYEKLQSQEPEYTRGLTLAQHRLIRRLALERMRKYVSVKDLCVARDALQRSMDEILGNPHASGRMKAARLNGLGSKGSWWKVHRAVELEYEGDGRSVVDLLQPDADQDGARGAQQDDGLPSEEKKLEVKPSADRPTLASQPEESLPDRARKSGIEVEGLDD